MTITVAAGSEERGSNQALIVLFAGGHALLVGATGLAKTRLVKALGTVLGLLASCWSREAYQPSRIGFVD